VYSFLVFYRYFKAFLVLEIKRGWGSGHFGNIFKIIVGEPEVKPESTDL
jgi:hypothetical protein